MADFVGVTRNSQFVGQMEILRARNRALHNVGVDETGSAAL